MRRSAISTNERRLVKDDRIKDARAEDAATLD
jgi:hypothetical protein